MKLNFTLIIISLSLIISIILYIDWSQSYPGSYSYQHLKTGKITKFKLNALPTNRWNEYQFLDSYNTREILEMPKPNDFPKFIKWDYSHKRAFIDGGIVFNDDSTFALIAHKNVYNND